MEENYSLTHKIKHVSVLATISIQGGKFAIDVKSASGNDHVRKTQGKSFKSGSGTSANRFPSGCYYCKNSGHIQVHCPKLLAKEKPVANGMLIRTDSVRISVDPEPAAKGPQLLFEPFQFPGTASVSEDGPTIPVNILRDTTASLNMVLEISVSNLEDAFTGEYVVWDVGRADCSLGTICHRQKRWGLGSPCLQRG